MHTDFWYAAPLIIAASLVYAATRHEELLQILQHAVRAAIWMVGFMAVVFVILYLIDWRLKSPPEAVEKQPAAARADAAAWLARHT